MWPQCELTASHYWHVDLVVRMQSGAAGSISIQQLHETKSFQKPLGSVIKMIQHPSASRCKWVMLYSKANLVS